MDESQKAMNNDVVKNSSPIFKIESKSLTNISSVISLTPKLNKETTDSEENKILRKESDNDKSDKVNNYVPKLNNSEKRKSKLTESKEQFLLEQEKNGPSSRQKMIFSLEREAKTYNIDKITWPKLWGHSVDSYDEYFAILDPEKESNRKARIYNPANPFAFPQVIEKNDKIPETTSQEIDWRYDPKLYSKFYMLQLHIKDRDF